MQTIKIPYSYEIPDEDDDKYANIKLFLFIPLFIVSSILFIYLVINMYHSIPTIYLRLSVGILLYSFFMIFDGISVVIKSEVCTLRFPGIMKIFTSIGSGPLDIVANLFTIGIPILFAMLAPNILSYVLPTYNSVESANDHLIFNTDTPMPTLTQTMTLDYSKGNVRGVIINSANILVQLIPQINGSFTLQMNDNYPKVYTDQKGEFIFVNIEPGYYIVVSPIIGKNYPGWKLFSEPSNSILIAGHITDLLANPFDYWYIKVKSGESIDLGILHQ